jgi:hypothetical protein
MKKQIIIFILLCLMGEICIVNGQNKVDLINKVKE